MVNIKMPPAGPGCHLALAVAAAAPATVEQQSAERALLPGRPSTGS